MKRNIYLSPEPNDGGTMVDPLDQQSGAINTDFPVLKGGIKDLEVVDGSKAPSKSNPNNEVLTFKMKTTQEDVDTKGEIVHPGYPLYHRIVVTPSEDRTGQRIAKDIAMFAKACGRGELTPRQIVNDPTLLNGSVARAKVVIQKETDEYPESNSVKSFVTN